MDSQQSLAALLGLAQTKPAKSNTEFWLGLLAGILIAGLGALAGIGLLNLADARQPVATQPAVDTVSPAVTELKNEVATLQQQLAQNSEVIQRLNTTLQSQATQATTSAASLTERLTALEKQLGYTSDWLQRLADVTATRESERTTIANAAAAPAYTWSTYNDTTYDSYGAGYAQYTIYTYAETTGMTPWLTVAVPCEPEQGVSVDGYHTVLWNWLTGLAQLITSDGATVSWNL